MSKDNYIHTMRLSMPCPNCKHRMIGYRTEQMTDMMQQVYYRCTNDISCGAVYGSFLTIDRFITLPKTLQNKGLNLAVSQVALDKEKIDFLRNAEVKFSESDEEIKNRTVPQLDLSFIDDDLTEQEALNEIEQKIESRACG